MKALDGLNILDLSRILAGPYCTQILSDLGATVWKVESPWGDDTRKLGPPFVEGESAYYLAVNRGKKSVVINLKEPRGQEIVKRMAAKADVLVENFKTGDLARYGLGYETLREINPGLVYTSITGFGNTGPRAGEPAVDTTLQGMTGIMSITGEPGRPPAKVGVAVIDLMTGLLAGIGILSALREREQSGKGQKLDLSLFDVGVMSMINVAQNFMATGEPPRPHGNAHPQIVPYQAFEASDGWFMLAVVNDNQFEGLSRVIGQPELAHDSRFLTNADRMAHKDELVAILSKAFSGGTRETWLGALKGAGISADAIYDFAESLRDAQAQARRVVWDLQHPTIGDLPVMANALQYMSRTPAEPQGAPPLLGEHTRDVLSGFATESELDSLERDEVIGTGH